MVSACCVTMPAPLAKMVSKNTSRRLSSIALNPARPERSTIVVFGSGAVGMAAIFAAAAIGMQTIIAVDLQDSRLEIAKAMGATHGINGRSGELSCDASRTAQALL